MLAKSIRSLSKRHFVSFHNTNRFQRNKSSFAVCFDIDGVLRRGGIVLPRAPEVLQTLSSNSIPHLFVTNGGGIPESKRAELLQTLLNSGNHQGPPITIDPHQMILSHTPMSLLADELGDKRVLLLGCRDEPAVARSYGFNRIVTAQEFAAQHPKLYTFRKLPEPQPDRYAEDPIEAIILMHDPADWHLELQVCCDVLQGFDPVGENFNSKAGSRPGVQIPVYNSNEDFVFSNEYPHPRFAQGAFLECLEYLYKRVAPEAPALQVERYGKPNPVTFNFAQQRLRELANQQEPFERIYMIGDNPHADIRGANLAGDPWRSVLVRTGVFDGTILENDPLDPADIVVDGVGDALDVILKEQGIQA